MLKPPSLKDLPHYPVTVSVTIMAVAATAAWWAGWDIASIATEDSVWAKWQLWRALTSTLPHVNIFHLAFNLYWFWVFGTLIERVFGHLKLAAIIVVLAFGSSLAEFALLEGGVGLSGVGYGLWAMLWVLEKTDARFHGAVDRQTTQTFVSWFFLCVVLTVTNIMPVANIAHAVGAGLGVLIGLSARAQGAERVGAIGGLVAVSILCVAGSTIFWSQVNLTDRPELAVERAGLTAMEKRDIPHAVTLLESAANMRKAAARTWYNLGIAYQRSGRLKDAARAYYHAAQMPDSDSHMHHVAEEFKYWR
jgi:membrane associated rhomboid family serine protease